MSAVRAFWWSPVRSPRLGWTEMRANPSAWVRLGATTGRPLLNFGDELVPLVLREVSGRDVRWAPPASAELIAVGSILDLYAHHAAGAAVWGTGLKHVGPRERMEQLTARLGPVLAVRGPLTRDALGLGQATTLGDPGLLAPLLLSATSRRRAVGAGGTVVVPHFRTWASPAGRRALARCRAAGLAVLPPSLAPLGVIEAIAGSSLVLTSSLHGLIVAHALGVPAQLVTLEDTHAGEPVFKYDDYLRSVGSTAGWRRLDDVVRGGGAPRVGPEAEGEVDRVRATAERLSAGLVTALTGYLR